MSMYSKREGYLDDYTNDLQCEDFYDDRWADEDFCLDDYYEDGEWLYNFLKFFKKFDIMYM